MKISKSRWLVTRVLLLSSSVALAGTEDDAYIAGYATATLKHDLNL